MLWAPAVTLAAGSARCMAAARRLTKRCREGTVTSAERSVQVATCRWGRWGRYGGYVGALRNDAPTDLPANVAAMSLGHSSTHSRRNHAAWRAVLWSSRARFHHHASAAAQMPASHAAGPVCTSCVRGHMHTWKSTGSAAAAATCMPLSSAAGRGSGSAWRTRVVVCVGRAAGRRRRRLVLTSGSRYMSSELCFATTSLYMCRLNHEPRR